MPRQIPWISLPILATVTYPFLTGKRNFVTAGRHGKVGRIAKDSGAIVVLADEQPFARSIALDDQFVYWVNGGTAGTINKTTK